LLIGFVNLYFWASVGVALFGGEAIHATSNFNDLFRGLFVLGPFNLHIWYPAQDAPTLFDICMRAAAAENAVFPWIYFLSFGFSTLVVHYFVFAVALQAVMQDDIVKEDELIQRLSPALLRKGLLLPGCKPRLLERLLTDDKKYRPPPPPPIEVEPAPRSTRYPVPRVTSELSYGMGHSVHTRSEDTTPSSARITTHRQTVSRGVTEEEDGRFPVSGIGEHPSGFE